MHIQQTWWQTVATTYTGLRVLFCLTLQAPILIQISVMSGNAAQAAGGAAGPPTKVLCLINIVAPEELVDEEEYDGNIVILTKLSSFALEVIILTTCGEGRDVKFNPNHTPFQWVGNNWNNIMIIAYNWQKYFHKHVRPVAHIPQWTSPISHDALFCNRNVHIRADFCYKMLHYGIYVWCIVGFVRWLLRTRIICGLAISDDWSYIYQLYLYHPSASNFTCIWDYMI